MFPGAGGPLVFDQVKTHRRGRPHSARSRRTVCGREPCAHLAAYSSIQGLLEETAPLEPGSIAERASFTRALAPPKIP
ncbi:hypothetical protein [Streptomyces sp. 058-1L]|uniref:hypothetical protein n=1 Tax=Streptomyces sp. 058-1L TaxID=2789266 RepID=UPI00397FD529